MKIGVKNYGDEEYFRALLNRADFFEVMAIPGKDYSYLDKLGKPITIHIFHSINESIVFPWKSSPTCHSIIRSSVIMWSVLIPRCSAIIFAVS